MASAQVDETSVTNNSHHWTPITQIIFFIQGIIVIDMVNKGPINWNWLFLLAVAEFKYQKNHDLIMSVCKRENW